MPQARRVVQIAAKVIHQMPTASTRATGLVSGVVPNSDPAVAGAPESRGKIMARRWVRSVDTWFLKPRAWKETGWLKSPDGGVGEAYVSGVASWASSCRRASTHVCNARTSRPARLSTWAEMMRRRRKTAMIGA